MRRLTTVMMFSIALLCVGPSCDTDSQTCFPVTCFDDSVKQVCDPPRCENTACASGSVCQTAESGEAICISAPVCQ